MAEINKDRDLLSPRYQQELVKRFKALLNTPNKYNTIARDKDSVILNSAGTSVRIKLEPTVRQKKRSL